jgi:bifunctional DNA-binding transcriptional regulator/antitoxin component of YhaV-PrlF toxin-antitoxin module
MQILQSAKITDKGRWPLGKELMEFLGVGVGDQLIAYRTEGGKVLLDVPVPRSERTVEAEASPRVP